VLVGLLVVALGYGAWIFLNSSPRFQVVAVDPVPEQIQRVTEQQEAPQVTVRSANPSQPASAIAATAEIDVSGPTPAADPETVTGGAHPAVQNTLDKIAETLAAVPETRPEAQSTEEPHPRPVQPDPTPAAENSLATEAVGTPPAAVTQQSTPVASSSAGTSSAQPALDPAVESPAPQQSGTRIQPEPEPDEISPSEETSPLSRPETPATAQTAYAIPSPQQRPLESAAPESTESALVGSESVPEQIAALPAGDTNPGSEQGLDQASAAIPTVDVSTTVAALPPQIVIRAVIDSWIQVRDMEENKLVMTKLLRSGDTYEVPARRGLSLLTGNAGALEIEVDGNLVPSIGLVGTVRRNVVLDAEKLTSGTAVVP